MAMKEKGVLLADFSGGLNTKFPPWLIEPNQSPDIRNIDIDAKPGVLIKRKGHVKYGAQISSSTGIHSLFVFRHTANAIFYTMCSSDTNVYKDVSGTWTKITSDDLTANQRVRYAVINDTVFFCNGTDTLKKWDGTTYAAAGGSPPTAATFILRYQSRLWLFSSSSYPSRVWHSAITSAGLPAPEDWSTPQNYGFWDINPNDGDYITGAVVFSDKIVVFKQWSIHAIYGSKPGEFYTRILTDEIGCINSETIAVNEYAIFFLSHKGVYMFTAENNKLYKASNHIQPSIDAIADNTSCVGGMYQNQYWMAFYKSGSSSNNRVYVLNYLLGAWVEYVGINANCFYYDESADTFFCGSPTTGYTYTLLSGTNDDGSNIQTYYESPAEAFEEEDKDKHLRKAYIVAATGTDRTMLVDYKVDTVLASSPETLALTPAGTETVTTKRVDFPQAAEGKYLSLVLYENSKLDAEVYATSVYSQVQDLR